MHAIEGTRELLESTFDAVFVVANALALQEGVFRMQPALAVLDLSVARGNLADVVAGLKQASPQTRLIALTVHEAPTAAAAIIAAGLQGVVLKRSIARDLLAAVDAVLRDETFVTPELAGVTPIPNPAR